MTESNAIQLFEDKTIRTIWDDKAEEWYFSIVDVIEVLTGTDRLRKYWSDPKKRLKKEGSEVSEKIGHLKMPSPDGKNRMTDVASTKAIFRLIQSIPSRKAEPFKLWLAEIGKQRKRTLPKEEATSRKRLKKSRIRNWTESCKSIER